MLFIEHPTQSVPGSERRAFAAAVAAAIAAASSAREGMQAKPAQAANFFRGRSSGPASSRPLRLPQGFRMGQMLISKPPHAAREPSRGTRHRDDITCHDSRVHGAP